MPPMPTVTSEVTMSNSFLTETVQVCVVTRDYQRTMEGLVQTGIGPWRVYTFDPTSVSDMTLLGFYRQYDVGNRSAADRAESV